MSGTVVAAVRHTLGQTALTETGRDNESPGILLPGTPFLHAALVSQGSPLKILYQPRYSRDTEENHQLHMCHSV